MSVQDTSKIALEKIRDKLPAITQKVFDVILDIGPTHNNRILEYLNQKESLKPRNQRRYWQINQVCGRVNDLVHIYRIVRDLRSHSGKWHGEPKKYHIWAVIGEDRKPVGWTPIPKVEKLLFA